MHSNIPNELRQLDQWVLADMTLGENGLPKKIPLNPRTGARADVMDSATWGSFADVMKTGHPHIGFVFSSNDPFAVIDLDDKENNPASENDKVRFKQIISTFASYTEVSVSGRGVHVVVKGQVPKGVNRDHVELYSSGRYMIFTGQVIRNYPIEERQELLTVLFDEMKAAEANRDGFELVQVEGDETDATIVDRASNASNGDKYIALCNGDMSGYPSQSEADLALLTIIAFYTKDNEQVRRLFRASALGKRAKANKDNKLIDNCLRIIRGNQAKQPEVNLEQAKKNAELIMTKPVAVNENSNSKAEFAYTTPPGLIGELVDYFLSTAIRPVHEVALAAALTLVAGVSSRSFNISGTGLNVYIVLLAKTGSGKEGALSGIEKLIAAVRPQVPMVDQFMGPAAFSSGQALIKVLNKKPCFFSVLGEFGLTLQEISDPRSNSATRMLKKVLLDLYAKSGATSVLRSSVYSDEEKNTSIVQAPNVTILGEATPETFFDALDASQISDGLIPRLSIINYSGGRPPRNENSNVAPSEALLKRFTELLAVSLTATNNNTCIPVGSNAEAQEMLDKFDKLADGHINSAKHDAEVQLWNRAHLKALKISGLLAVGINPHVPTVTKELATWAINFVKQDIEFISARFATGDVGNGETKQMADLKRSIEQFINSPHSAIESYKVEFKVHEAKIIPFSYLSKKLSSIASYRTDKMGATNALKRNIQSLIEFGCIIQVPALTMNNSFGITGNFYTLTGKNW